MVIDSMAHFQLHKSNEWSLWLPITLEEYSQTDLWSDLLPEGARSEGESGDITGLTLPPHLQTYWPVGSHSCQIEMREEAGFADKGDWMDIMLWLNLKIIMLKQLLPTFGGKYYKHIQ